MPIITALKKDLKAKFWKRFRYSRNPIRQWYQFKDNRWHTISMLSIKNYFTTFAKDIEYVNLKEALYHPNFYQKLDSKIHLIGFENGVYDTKRQMFREGIPSDYIFKTTGYPYSKPNISDISSVDMFLSDLFSNDEKTRFLDYCLDCFRDINEKKLWLFTGLTCSGKSTIISLMEKAFGQYFRKARLEKQQGDLHRELAHTYRCRLVHIYLDSCTDDLLLELSKLVSGELMTKDLYTNYIKRLEYQVVLSDVEKDMSINGKDKDIPLKKSQFNIQFVKQPISINQRLQDLNIHDKIPGWTLAFMYLILLH